MRPSGYAKFYSRAKSGEVRVFGEAGAMTSAENWPGNFHPRARGEIRER
jgi:hypothetical protein